MRITSPILLAMIVSVASSAVCAAAPAPFNATIIFDESISFGAPPCPLIGELNGAGPSQTLGHVKFTSTDCINPVPPNFVFTSQNVVLTTNSGDQIWLMYAGLMAADGTVTGFYTVTGGTGAFTHAKGSGTIAGHEDLTSPITGKGSVTLQGTIRH